MLHQKEKKKKNQEWGTYQIQAQDPNFKLVVTKELAGEKALSRPEEIRNVS